MTTPLYTVPVMGVGTQHYNKMIDVDYQINYWSVIDHAKIDSKFSIIDHTRIDSKVLFPDLNKRRVSIS